MAIQRGQGRQRRALVAVFAVVVVLDDPAVRLPCPVQERQASRQRQHRAGGILVRRGDIDQPAVRPVCQLLHHQPCRIHRDSLQPRPATPQGQARGAIAGIFHGRQGARRQQQPGAEFDGLLGTAGDEDLLGCADQAPRLTQIGAQQAAQSRFATRFAIAQQRRFRLTPEALLQPRPGGEGKQIHRRQADSKGARRAGRHAGQGHGGRPGRGFGSGQCLGHGRDIGAVARTAVEKTLGQQLLVGGGHGIARHVQEPRQFATGG